MATQWINFDKAIQGDIQKYTVEVARKALADAKSADPTWADHRVIVDGKFDRPIESVKEFGKIQLVKKAELGEIVEWIWRELIRRSPVLKGTYQDSHVLMINGTSVQDIRNIQPGDKVQFVNSTPYARRIENGLSNRAPSGVYRSVFAAARRKYGKLVFLDYRFVKLNLGVKVLGKAGGSKYNRKKMVDQVYPAIQIRMVK